MAAAVEEAAPRSRAWLRYLALGAALALVFISIRNRWLQSATSVGVYAASTALLARSGMAARRRPDDTLVHVLLAGAVAYLAAASAWYFWPLLTGRALPGTSVVDALYFTSYALFAVFLLMLGRRYRSYDPRGSLDAVIVVTGIAPLFWILLIEPQIRGDITLTTLTYLAYPLFVAVLLGLGVRVAFGADRRSVPYLLLGGWLAGELVGDILYAQSGIAGTFEYGQPWQAVWVLSFTCLGSLALHRGTRELGAHHESRLGNSRVRLLLLGVSLSLPILTLVYAEVRHLDGRPVLFCAGAALLVIVLVCFRLSGLMVDLAAQRRLHEELKELAESFEHQSTHDPLTGLGNRVMFRDRAEHALAQRTTSPDEAAAILLLDLDDFKAINDTLGHDAGDRVLVEVARRLSGVTRQGEWVARLGGDEFALVLTKARLGDALNVADRIHAALAEPFTVGPRVVRPSGSIGISIALRGQDRSTLLAEADIAMYAAKSQGSRAPAVFDPELHHDVLDRHQLESDLREAVTRDELRLLFQPLVRLATNEIVGVEALVRWEHATRGTISPLQFIPLAEMNGTILSIGDWVLQESCRQLRVWDSLLLSDHLRISVNVSPRQLADPDFIERVAAVFKWTGIDPGRVTLEVTEAALGSDTETMIQRLDDLKRLGVLLAIDDFGTGYSSLSHLRQLPVDVLKVDRSFVSGIAREPAEWALTTAIIRLATSLGKQTLAEGIETGGQLAHLRSLNCEYGQGYLFSKPVSADAIVKLLRSPVGEAFSFG